MSTKILTAHSAASDDAHGEDDIGACECRRFDTPMKGYAAAFS